MAGPHQVQFIVSQEELDNSPTRLDGVSENDEEVLRWYGTETIVLAGVLLRLPQVVMATAQTLFHRFYAKQSMKQHDVKAIAPACIWVATKLEEQHRRARDILSVFHRLYLRQQGHPNPPPLEIYLVEPGEKISAFQKLYEEMKECELLLLKEFGFILHMEHPHKMIITFLHYLEASAEFNQEAWSLCNDSLRTTLCLKYSPTHLACGIIFLAARRMQIALPEDPPWWEVFHGDLLAMYDVARTVQALYSRPKPVYIKITEDPPALAPLQASPLGQSGTPSKIVLQNGNTGPRPGDSVKLPTSSGSDATRNRGAGKEEVSMDRGREGRSLDPPGGRERGRGERDNGAGPRERDRHKDRDADRRDRHRYREKDRERDRDRDRDVETKDRYKQRDKPRNGDRHRERDRYLERGRSRSRERDRQRSRDERERGRGRGLVSDRREYDRDRDRRRDRDEYSHDERPAKRAAPDARRAVTPPAPRRREYIEPAPTRPRPRSPSRSVDTRGDGGKDRGGHGHAPRRPPSPTPSSSRSSSSASASTSSSSSASEDSVRSGKRRRDDAPEVASPKRHATAKGSGREQKPIRSGTPPGGSPPPPRRQRDDDARDRTAPPPPTRPSPRKGTLPPPPPLPQADTRKRDTPPDRPRSPAGTNGKRVDRESPAEPMDTSGDERAPRKEAEKPKLGQGKARRHVPIVWPSK